MSETSPRSDDPNAVRKERPKREERTDLILDAAAELVLRWGYKKTTIDDIARQAGVAKGTIYLHWRSREELFEALVLREWLLSTKETLERIFADEKGVMLHTMVEQAVLVALGRPLIRALFLRDADMWGEVVERRKTVLRGDDASPQGQEASAVYGQRLRVTTQVIQLLREKGMVRTDMSVEELLYMLSAITFGYMAIEQYLPDSLQMPVEAVAKQVGEVVRRTMEPETVAPEVVQEVTEVLKGMYAMLLQEMEKRIQG